MVSPTTLTLGPTYEPDLWDLRKRVAADRKSGGGVTTVAVRAPINSEAIEVAILSGSLYLVGVRKPGGQWHEFAADDGLPSSALLGDARPKLPGSRWIRVGDRIALASYRALRINDMLGHAAGAGRELAFAGTPGALVGFFASWDGRLNANHDRLHMCVLIFLISEALRFRSIEQACSNWIKGRGSAATSLSLVITADMIDRVQNWKARAGAGDPDVWTWLPGMADPLIS